MTLLASLCGVLDMYRGTKVILRPFEWEDAKKYCDWINDSEMMQMIDRVLPVTLLEHQDWYEEMIRSSNVIIFAIEVASTQEFVGCIWLHNIDTRHQKSELRILIGEKKYWGKGIGTDATDIIVRLAFKHFNLRKIYAEVLMKNLRAKGVFEKSGFKLEGVLRADRYICGVYEDVARFGIVRTE